MKHAPGTFCWVELSTPDSKSATHFYTTLFGWTTQANPIPGGGAYVMLKLDDGYVGALFQQGEHHGQGEPPHWQSYVAVDNADATAKKVESLGGKIVQDTFDVMTAGRMAVLEDPTGASFSIWQAKDHTGVGHIGGKINTMCWNELVTKDTDRAGKFYSDLLPWKMHSQDEGATPYTTFQVGDDMAAGMLPMPAEGAGNRAHWMTYFAVADCDTAVGKANELGGQTQVPPTDIAYGRFAVMADPQGAMFSIIELKQF